MQRVDYADGSTRLSGWLAVPERPARGGIVVFPTIANVTPAVERRAAMLVEAGFVTLIADFYGEKPEEPAKYRTMAEALWADRKAYRRRLRSAVDALRRQPQASRLPLAAIGYCMGGGAAIELARDGADLVACVSFHGLLETTMPAQPGAVRARLLICHGDADPMVPRDHVLQFWEEMDEAGADWHFHSYSGAKHGFTDPDSDARGLPAIAYDASADRQSWAAMMSLLDELFAG